MPQRSVLGSALRRIVSTPNENDLLQRCIGGLTASLVGAGRGQARAQGQLATAGPGPEVGLFEPPPVQEASAATATNAATSRARPGDDMREPPRGIGGS